MRLALAAVLLFACADRKENARQEERAAEQARQAEQAAKRAVQEAEAARQKVEALVQEMSAVDAQIGEAVNAVTDANNDAERNAAAARLKELQKQQAELRVRVEQARASAQKTERLGGVKVSKECLENPLAKGCS